MNTTLLSIADRCYRGLLRVYPAPFRQRYGVEMAQVFRTSCRVIYNQAGKTGILKFWFFTLGDWVLSTAYEQISSLLRRSEMSDTTTFDRQLGDAIWMLTVGLRSAYSLKDVINALAQETPEPAAGAFKQLNEDLASDISMDDAFEKLQKAVPSAYLAEMLAIIQQQRQTGENLADLLDPLSEKIIQEAGSDPALYPAMREQARILGANVPERAK